MRDSWTLEWSLGVVRTTRGYQGSLGLAELLLWTSFLVARELGDDGRPGFISWSGLRVRIQATVESVESVLKISCPKQHTAQVIWQGKPAMILVRPKSLEPQGPEQLQRGYRLQPMSPPNARPRMLLCAQPRVGTDHLLENPLAHLADFGLAPERAVGEPRAPDFGGQQLF